jgi:hypothetical protein
MILSLVLPRMGELTRPGTVRRVIARAGDALRPGAPLLEVHVDLDGTSARDCPAAIVYRLIATERAYLRRLSVAPGDVLEVAAPIGLATTSLEEAFDGPPVRALRTTPVSIQVDPLAT